jgi:hypothetical protein
MNKLTIGLLSMAIAALSAKADEHSVIATDNIEWGLLNPLRGDASPRAADLWGDRTKNTATGMLVKFKKGFSSPPHIHNISYRGVVIEGLMHNDDPSAIETWLQSGSFWTQSAGESHITAANAQDNLIYLETDSGPYLVLPKEQAFDNGERSINVDAQNLVWLDAKEVTWLASNKAHIAYLWGNTEQANGSFIKLPAGFEGTIENDGGLKALVVKGKAAYQWNNNKTISELSPSSFFSAKAKGSHAITAETELILYINSNGRYTVK